MRNDSRLSRMLHVLLHMARHDGPMTSEVVARMLGTNPVVVRRTMAGLRKAGYVRSEKGHGGGWSIAMDLTKVSLLDVHRAVGGPRIFAIGSEHPNPDCAVEKIVNEAVEGAMREAEALLISRLGEVSLAELAKRFDMRCTRAIEARAPKQT
ncbi:DNA-binding IscR family transcriptional regulator [Sinorhizobium fredii]|uniref:Transcriptional regulator, BadM/Rrf2 family n=1 Tax=Sinorhizobium fredii (strain USDA 257) TaxID=1185652 RepID=I3X405_SINF2|nr:Rrf2 family transcriptional regulator [Sinorhizobium fredii]AFL50611.1 transcriptional regulator, BadM/Rrf2 family [Sinorhizobium fredii USDA 257]